jgi:hypothetical protein
MIHEIIDVSQVWSHIGTLRGCTGAVAVTLLLQAHLLMFSSSGNVLAPREINDVMSAIQVIKLVKT